MDRWDKKIALPGSASATVSKRVVIKKTKTML